MATLEDLIDINPKALYAYDLYPEKQIRHLTINDLTNLFYLLDLQPTGKTAAGITLNYLTKLAIERNKQIF